MKNSNSNSNLIRRRLRLPWDPKEDQIITDLMSRKTKVKWKKVAMTVNQKVHKLWDPRKPKQVKARWVEVIKPLL